MAGSNDWHGVICVLTGTPVGHRAAAPPKPSEIIGLGCYRRDSEAFFNRQQKAEVPPGR